MANVENICKQYFSTAKLFSHYCNKCFVFLRTERFSAKQTFSPFKWKPLRKINLLWNLFIGSCYFRFLKIHSTFVTNASRSSTTQRTAKRRENLGPSISSNPMHSNLRRNLNSSVPDLSSFSQIRLYLKQKYVNIQKFYQHNIRIVIFLSGVKQKHNFMVGWNEL